MAGERTREKPSDAWEQLLVDAFSDCKDTKDRAERLLNPWLIRRNRSPNLRAETGHTQVPRRHLLVGRTILEDHVAGPRESGQGAMPYVKT